MSNCAKVIKDTTRKLRKKQHAIWPRITGILPTAAIIDAEAGEGEEQRELSGRNKSCQRQATAMAN